ncbi:hypothetical protein CC86DRAFT_365025 [Ophiobolus disseminans]|uniref:Uncharacterized protein n=1 Tax=Ophiobolus disseminans TaxID=1469910 RepID=A0A6A7AIH7_9PLEO|nr:hypothetical protein CC86DRAFT_365025 [Ophiobolus disseminans]
MQNAASTRDSTTPTSSISAFCLAYNYAAYVIRFRWSYSNNNTTRVATSALCSTQAKSIRATSWSVFNYGVRGHRLVWQDWSASSHNASDANAFGVLLLPLRTNCSTAQHHDELGMTTHYIIVITCHRKETHNPIRIVRYYTSSPYSPYSSISFSSHQVVHHISSEDKIYAAYGLDIPLHLSPKNFTAAQDPPSRIKRPYTPITTRQEQHTLTSQHVLLPRILAQVRSHRDGPPAAMCKGSDEAAEMSQRTRWHDIGYRQGRNSLQRLSDVTETLASHEKKTRRKLRR